jgi:hypothetical protein
MSQLFSDPESTPMGNLGKAPTANSLAIDFDVRAFNAACDAGHIAAGRDDVSPIVSRRHTERFTFGVGDIERLTNGCRR